MRPERTTIGIRRRRNRHYMADLEHPLSAGLHDRDAGATPIEAARFTIQALREYGQTNPSGAALTPPKEVTQTLYRLVYGRHRLSIP